MFLNNPRPYLCVVDYQECLTYLFSKLPMFSRTGPAAIKPDLTNTLALCNHLGNPQNKFKSIHIAGTNGKGSVSHMLASIFQEQGYKTGLYTSPHLKDFRERIKINGEMISKEAVVDFTDRIKHFIEEIEPSFFEVTVGMAFEYFAENKVDLAIIETGLGGRLDSTNVIDPEISVITNIGFDHMSLLGNTLEAISTEKAGIIKKEKPVVVGRTQMETVGVFKEKSHSMNAPIFFADEEYSVGDVNQSADLLTFNISNKNKFTRKITSNLNSLYQLENIRTVVATIDHLSKTSFHIEEHSLIDGIRKTSSNTGLRGRWEKISDQPTVIIDVGHNPDGIKEIIRQLSNSTYKNLFIIIGLSKDKDYLEILSMLPKEAEYGFTQANIPRALEADTLKDEALKFGLKGQAFSDVNLALGDAKSKANAEDLILICGSLFVIGELEF